MVHLYQPIFKYFDVSIDIMPRLIQGSIYPIGDKHIVLSQETTGELKALAQGKHGDTITPLEVDSGGNLMDYTSRGLLEQILLELQKFNVQISMITDHEIMESDIDGNK
jgi:hypothetical protein